MSISHQCRRFLLAVALAAVCGVLAAGERCDLHFVNEHAEEIIDIRVKYSTPYGEPRFDRSRVNLSQGEEYRIGVQGTTLPELIIIDLATKSYVFDQLSGLEPANEMRLAIVHEDGKPGMRRLDAEGRIEGTEKEYLTVANRPNAVDKDILVAATTLDEVGEVITQKIEEERENLGELDAFDVEAGPIWNQAHAQERCPEVALEWGEKNDREARWTGQWTTTVPGEMSVCGCMAGTADMEETITIEDEGWGKTAYFPVFWQDWHGIGYVSETGVSDDGLAVGLRFRLREDAVAMLDALFSDLRVDGYRPVRFALKRMENKEGGREAMLESEINFGAEKDDKWDAHDRIMEALSEGYAGDVLEGTLAWVEDDAFEKAREGGEVPGTRGVLCFFTKETFEAFFIPDGMMLLEGVATSHDGGDDETTDDK